jgi:hypothetical protein
MIAGTLLAKACKTPETAGARTEDHRRGKRVGSRVGEFTVKVNMKLGKVLMK